MPVHHLDQVQVVTGVGDDAVEIAERIERHVAVVVLHRLLLEFGAGSPRPAESPGGFAVRFLQRPVVIEQGRLAARTRAVRPALDLHLEQPEVRAQLDLQSPVAALDPARAHAPGS